MNNHVEAANHAYALSVAILGQEVHMHLTDLVAGFDLAEGSYAYRLSRVCEEGSMVARTLGSPTVWVDSAEAGVLAIRITGSLAGLSLEHSLKLPAGSTFMEERIRLSNDTRVPIGIESFVAGMRKRIASGVGAVVPGLESDRLVAIPFRHRPSDLPGVYSDFGLADLLERPGRERGTDVPQHGNLASTQWPSEGWAWTHDNRTLGVFKFNQEFIEFSMISPELSEGGISLRFGGANLSPEIPLTNRCVEPGSAIEFGVTRYASVSGDYEPAYYAFREFLDENGCRFPKGFNPPVHWNELYDNPEWHVGTPGTPPGRRMTRPVTYTKELIEREAAKAREYSCEALYLDPGWDTDFGTFLWGEEWLGPRKEFVREMRERYGLDVSLHCPLATWMSVDGRGVSSWPEEAIRMDANGNIIKSRICLGSKQYLDEAARRMLEHCADGVVFLMFDGNRYHGPCWNRDHGHPVPYTTEDHCRANVRLARKIHEAYPQVLIEMHDMIAGGSDQHCMPVYYKYGLPGSYDENWGFELMWQPMEDVRSGRCRSLYYYNLGTNIPVYLHVDLRDDNEHCVVFWWYASTCRHLGIGGTNENPLIAQAHKLAMQRYRKLGRFYKEGEFWGINEEVHVHALPDEGAFVVNLFNLSDESRLIGGTIRVADMNLDRDRWYVRPKGGRFNKDLGTFTIERRLAPWSAQVAEVRQVPGQGDPEDL